MRKTTLILVLLLTLTGCNSAVNTPERSENSAEIPQTDSEINLADSSILPSLPENLENSNDSRIEIIAPDGSILDLSTTTKNAYDEYAFDFSFVRFAKTPLCTTLDISDKSEWEQIIENQKIEISDYTKIKVGDKLENGLVVKSATTSTGETPATGVYRAEFDGELTLGGVLYLYPDGEWYNVDGGDLIFLADPAQSDPIPILSSALNDEYSFRFFNVDGSDFEASGDHTMLRLGNITDCEIDLSGTISAGEYVKAKIKVNGFGGYCSDTFGSGLYANLVSAERLYK